ncbi:MAG: hypothetical protein K9I85_10900 [Saprospiraceae bacterium]|nr:hypothetical protein [Saprospiraceae bacterium]
MLSATHIHAMLVHFPIALVIVGFLSELVGLVLKRPFFRQVGWMLLLLGAAGAVAAYFTGKVAGEGMEDGALGRALSTHMEAAGWAVAAILAAVGLRIIAMIFDVRFKSLKWIALIGFAAAVGALGRTGYLGGQLVFRHGAGIELGLGDFPSDDTSSGVKEP